MSTNYRMACWYMIWSGLLLVFLMVLAAFGFKRTRFTMGLFMVADRWIRKGVSYTSFRKEV